MSLSFFYKLKYVPKLNQWNIETMNNWTSFKFTVNSINAIWAYIYRSFNKKMDLRSVNWQWKRLKNFVKPVSTNQISLIIWLECHDFIANIGSLKRNIEVCFPVASEHFVHEPCSDYNKNAIEQIKMNLIERKKLWDKNDRHIQFLNWFILHRNACSLNCTSFICNACSCFVFLRCMCVCACVLEGRYDSFKLNGLLYKGNDPFVYIYTRIDVWEYCEQVPE